MKALKLIKQSLLHFFFPSSCVHCQELLIGDNQFLCDSCQSHLDLLSTKKRCKYCFNLFEDNLHFCKNCKKNRNHPMKMAAAFSYEGPAASLIRKFKYENYPYFAKGLAGFLALQFIELNWSSPDWVIPVPMSFMKKLDRGYNQSELLAQEFAALFNFPYKCLLKRSHGDYSQAKLDLERRKKLNQENFVLAHENLIKDKTILLIDDVYTTGSTLKCCINALYAGMPASIYCLTVCKTELD